MAVIIVVDPGHGGKDPGAIGADKKTQEADVVLKTGRLVRDYLNQYEGVKVVMTRDSDKYLGLSERAAIANRAKATYFISLHNNSYSDPDAGGFETYIYNGGVSKNTVNWRAKVHAYLSKYVAGYGVRDRGMKRANFAVVRETAMPAVLVEMAFISNPRELKLLKSDEFLKGFARELAEAVADIFNLKKKKASPKPTPQPEPPAGGLWVVQAGAFKNRDNAKALADKIKEKVGVQCWVYQEK